MVGRSALPVYGCRYSRKDYTQPQLFARFVLRQLLRTDYRGVVTLVGEWSELRQTLGLSKVPHYSSLAYASRRILAGADKKGLSVTSRRRLSNEPAPLA
ncbi:hypothetical protein [Antarcticirhabdus aurantiaca]|uniref:Uncharacterized protein n=1 Tax=Antarcticirhabdus aurantiaca TaxID=2606717 RepID=A0ACD4NND8_9HYPH|nr:hypothetical protein [Antarcticirhabdus aurantiaca]WAJ28238.1 hypothetical protein OXU80_26035 [Jeongeuplla avenae]